MKPIGAAAGFLIETGMLTPDVVTTNELTIELTAAGTKPVGAYTVMPHALAESGGIKIGPCFGDTS